jgi:hypothetical protein
MIAFVALVSRFSTAMIPRDGRVVVSNGLGGI